MNNVIIAKFSKGVYSTTAKVFRYDVGDKLQFVGLDLPNSYRVDFSNSTMGESKTVFCDSDMVEIPPEYFIPGSTIYAWIVLTQENGRYTKYQVNIPISARAKPLDIEPTPAQQDALDEAIEALNDVTDDIQGNIDAALEEAKASGEFDGTTIWLYDGTPILPDYTFYKYLMRANANAVVRQFDFILLGSILYQIISVSEFTCRAIKFIDLKGAPGQTPIVSVRREGQNYSQIIVDTDGGRQVYNVDNLLTVYFELWDNLVVHDAPTVSKLGEALSNNCSVLAVVKLPLSPEYGGSITDQIRVVAPLTYWKQPAPESLADSEILWQFEFKTKIDDDHILRIYKDAGANSKWQYEILEDYTLTEAEKTKLENLKIGSCSAMIHNGDNVVIYHPDVEKIREQLSARYDAIFCEVQFTDDMPDDPDGRYQFKAKELLSLSTFDHTGPGEYAIGTITDLAFTNASHFLVYSRTEIMGRVRETWTYSKFNYANNLDVVHIAQGIENAGKILGIDKHGMVEPQDPPTSGASSYDDLDDRPQINGHTLSGDQSPFDLGLAPAGAYVKPSDGIPKTDLAEEVQTSLGKADTALQEHQSLSGYATETWVQQQGYLTQHQDISGKLDKNQGTVNSGKVLTVGADGNVVPQDSTSVQRIWWTDELTVSSPPAKTASVAYSLLHGPVTASSSTVSAGDYVIGPPFPENLQYGEEITGDPLWLYAVTLVGSGSSCSLKARVLIPEAVDMSVYRTADDQDAIDYQLGQAILGKLDVRQGTAHAGEFLVVGSDGNVTTKTMSAWQGGNY